MAETPPVTGRGETSVGLDSLKEPSQSNLLGGVLVQDVSVVSVLLLLQQLLELLVVVEGSEVLHHDRDREGQDEDTRDSAGHANLR